MSTKVRGKRPGRNPSNPREDPPESVIVRAARAVDNALAGRPDFGTNDHERIVKAVLRAIREPDGMMFMRGGNTAVSNCGKDHLWPRPGKRIGDVAAYDSWQTMIDAALERV